MSRPLFTFKNMITKTYKANTNISINVVLPSKKNLHIAFVPLSNGSSVFTTDNEDIQKSVENHLQVWQTVQTSFCARAIRDSRNSRKSV